MNEFVSSYVKKELTTSSFGIGDDFDEKIMEGISSSGKGTYLYVEKDEDIPKYVSKALTGLMGVYGTQSNLKVKGKNGFIVESFYKEDINVIDGYPLQDLYSSNLKQVLVEVSVAPTSAGTFEAFTYQLSYIKNGIEQIITGSIQLTAVEDEKLMKNEEKEVKVETILKDCAEIEKKVLKLIEDGKSSEAVGILKESIKLMETVLDSDETGRIKISLARTKKSIEKF